MFIIFIGCFKTIFKNDHIVVVSVMLCVNICIKHGIMDFTYLYKLMYIIVGDLLFHYYND